jgi:hypothetical protein
MTDSNNTFHAGPKKPQNDSSKSHNDSSNARNGYSMQQEGSSKRQDGCSKTSYNPHNDSSKTQTDSLHKNPLTETPNKSRAVINLRTRLIAAGVFLALALIITLLALSAAGLFDLSPYLGICGFKQRTGLPCPGCEITSSAKAFFSGHPLQSLYIQPAGAVFSFSILLSMIFALLIALLGVDFGILGNISWPAFFKYTALIAVFVILTGWAVTLARAYMAVHGQ